MICRLKNICLFLGLSSILIFVYKSTTNELSSSTTDLDEKQREDFFKNSLNNSDAHLMWFVQITDLHISIFHDQTRIEQFEFFVRNILNLIKPMVVLVSGDLTDAKDKNMIGSGQNEEEWKTYKKIVTDSGVLNFTKWLDVRGNHDNFDVHQKDRNFYSKYGITKNSEKSFKYDLKLANGDKYSFIGIDGCIEPGPRRPYNFFGRLEEKDLERIKNFSQTSHDSNGTIWFGHFPTSTIHSVINLHNLFNNGVAYLCGHLHTLAGLLPSMYSRHSNGLLELELGDWKDNRMFRILAFDSGIFSFRDFKLKKNLKNNSIFILITNPKDIQFKTDREPFHRARFSTHIRFLIFSSHQITSAKVFVDELPRGTAVKANNSKVLYTLEWNAFEYSTGVHEIKIIVEDDKKNIQIVSQNFALDNSVKSFGILSNFILLVDQIYFTRTAFYLSTSGILLALIFFRYNRKRFSVRFVTCEPARTILLGYLRRFVLLTSIDYIYWSLIFMTIYVFFGPWFVGEILGDHWGVCFSWGIIVKGAFLSADAQYINGTLHMIFFQFLSLLDLSSVIETRFVNLTFHEDNPPNLKIFAIFFQNLSFLFILLFSLLNLYELYLSYSLISIIICPFKTWFLVYFVHLRIKCQNFSLNDFKGVIEIPKFSNQFCKSPRKVSLINDDDDIKIN